VYADSAYTGQEDTLKKYEVVDQICEKGYKNKPLTDEQQLSNKDKSSGRTYFRFYGKQYGLYVQQKDRFKKSGDSNWT